MRLFSSFKKLISDKTENKGSVMVTVLITFFFVSILVAIILSTVVVNFRMRSVDRSTKDEFYYAEKTLNDIYTGLGQDCSKLMGETYNIVLSQYKSAGYTDESKAYAAFVKKFVEDFNADFSGNIVTKFNGYIVQDTHKKGSVTDKTSRATVKNYGALEYYTDSNRTTKINNIATEAEKVHCIVVKNVRVQSNPDAEKNIGYASEISADIVIDVPRVSFFNTNSKVYDYALLANEGLMFGKDSVVNISGNVYGGTLPFGQYDNVTDSTTGAVKIVGYNNMSNSYEYGGIYLQNGANVTIQDAQYVVSGGDISVDGATFTVIGNGRNNQIWFENIEVNGASTVDIGGDLFAADDLQVNKGANGSQVTISGSYYGYNDGAQSVTVHGDSKDWTLTTKKAQITNKDPYQRNVEGSSESPNSASISSSILMNASNATINMTNMKTVLLLGNAYIDHNSKTGVVSVDEGKIMDAELPESAAIKASQNLTLVPTEFLGISNPAICKDPGDPFEPVKTSIITKMNTDNWFGKSYIDTTNPYKIVRVKQGIQTYAYCYLNFKSDQDKIDYVKAIVESTESNPGNGTPSAYAIKSDILKQANLYTGKVIIDDTNTRIFAKNSGFGYDGSTITLLKNTVDKDTFKDYSTNLYTRYRILDTYLDPLQEISLSVSNPLLTRNIDFQDFKTKDNEMPMGRFFWLWGLRKVGAHHATGTDIDTERDKYGSNFVVVRDSDTGLGPDIGPILSGLQNAFVIIDGNACIGNDVNINGFIACSGKLTIKDGVKVNITFDSTLLNKRIAAELKDVEKNKGFGDDKEPQHNSNVNKLLVNYLLSSNRNNLYFNGSKYKMKKPSDDLKNTDMKDYPQYREYVYTGSSSGDDVNSINTDYANFVYFDNWKKGLNN